MTRTEKKDQHVKNLKEKERSREQKTRVWTWLSNKPSEGFWNDDYEPVRDKLEGAGMRVSVASSKWNAESSDGSVSAPVDLLVNEASPDDYDAVVFVGSHKDRRFEFVSSEDQKWAEAAHQLIKGMDQRGKLISSLCGGNVAIVDSGVANGRPMAWNEYIDARNPRNKHAPIRIEDEQIVETGNLLTARDYWDSKTLAMSLIHRLNDLNEK